MAERIHNHDGAPVSHHHHAAGHHHNEDTKHTPHDSNDEGDEGTCFQQIAPSLTKYEVLSKVVPAPARNFADYLRFYAQTETFQEDLKQVVREIDGSKIKPRLAIFSSAVAPNAPPCPFIL